LLRLRPAHRLWRRQNPWPDIKRGLDKAAAMGSLEEEVCAVGSAKMRS